MKNTKKSSARAKKVQETKSFWQHWKAKFTKHPLISYILVTALLMGGVYLAEIGGQLFKASLLEVPRFDGTVSPVREVPNWVQTGGKNDRPYSDYATSELINLPTYDGAALGAKCTERDPNYLNACITFSTPYMGSYKMNSKEYDGSHIAVDIRIPEGTPLYAVANGVIETAKQGSTGFGNYIVLKVPDADLVGGGTDTLYVGYAHMSKLDVQQGQVVKKGDLIGYSGNTGTSTTPHLHFQIDRKAAPYHPWWPFTSAQASAAGLSFFEAINNGLGQEEGKTNTVNPMLWIQTFASGSSAPTHGSAPETNTNNTTPEIKEEALGSFKIQSKTTTGTIGEEIRLVLTAMNEEGRTFKAYNNSELKIESGERSFEAPSFRNGIASLDVELAYTTETIVISDGSVRNEITLTAEEEVVEEQTLVDFSITADKKSGTIGDEVTLTITALDSDDTVFTDYEGEPELESDERSLDAARFRNGVASVSLELIAASEVISIKDGSASAQITLTATEEVTETADVRFELSTTKKSILPEEATTIRITAEGDITETVKLELDGVGSLEKMSLSADDFADGEASVSFSSEEAGEAEISIEGTRERIEIKVIEGVSDIHHFELEGENFTVDAPFTLTIKTVDANDTVTAKEVMGTVILSVEDGAAELETTELTHRDFENGRATVEVTPSSAEELTIKAKLGAYVGEVSLNVKKTDGASIFPDVPASHPNYEAIVYLKEEGIVNGNADGTYKPNDPVNRAAFAKILLLALEKDIKTPKGGVFTDVPQDAWFAEFAETAASLGIIKGYPDGTFGPSKTINRAELFTMLYRASGESVTNTEVFSDVPQDTWFTDPASFAKQWELLDFGADFFPNKSMTRGEVAEAVYRYLTR